MSPRRRGPDPEGTRRASREFGPKARGYGARSQASADRRARNGSDRPKAKPSEGRGARLGRRLRAVGRFGSKHRGSLLATAGCAGIAATVGLGLVGFELSVLATSATLSLGLFVAGGVANRHAHNRTMHRSPNVETPTWRQRDDFEDRMRRPRQQQSAGGGPVPVSGSDRARAHTRARPNEAKAS